MRIVWLLVVSLTLISCGGGGSDSANSPTPSVPSPAPAPQPDFESVTPIKTADGYSFFGDTLVEQQSSVSFAVVADNNDSLRSVTWTQVSGPSVLFLSPDSQIIAFDVREAGDYLFEVVLESDTGDIRTEMLDLTVQDTLPAEASIRLDHVVSETAKASLRVDGLAGKVIDSISWQQLEGPQVTDLVEQGNYLFFTAPAVNSDTPLRFESVVSYVDGTSDSDDSLVLVKDVTINDDGYFPRYNNQIVTTELKPYRTDSPYADSLMKCIYNNTLDRSCQFSSLPLIGNKLIDPSIDDILDRVLVSHSWMGDRFKEYLERSVAAPDMLRLLRAVTGIVISYDVRPSFYWSATGAIYLDGNNFWVTPEERDTLNDQPDYRSDFGNDLTFFMPWRYIKDNDYYFRGADYPADERQTKSFQKMEANITWLMYHELGHANDFFPPEVWARVSDSDSPLAFSDANPPLSEAFSRQYPLLSAEMSALAQVSFSGESASDTQKSYDAETITTFFEPDLAPAYYSYATIREDYATLFERFMMAYRMGVSADVAVISTEQEGFAVTWGQRGRIALDKMRPRLTSVVDSILPELNVTQNFPQLPPAQLMKPGDDWRDNTDLTSSKASPVAGKGRSKAKSQPHWLIGVQHGQRTRPSQ